MMLFTFIWICVSAVIVESKTKLADVIPLCSLNDVNLNSCLKSSSQSILPALANGIKGWNLNSLDPFFVPLIIIGQDEGPISIRWEHVNTTITGFGKANITRASLNKKGNIYDFAFDALINGFSMTGEFKARGRMLLFPIRNEGHQEIHSGASSLKITLKAKPEIRNKKEHLKIENLKLQIGFSKDIKVVIKNYSKKPTQMHMILSKFLTTNAQELTEEMRPAFEQAFGLLIRTYLQSLFNKVPLEELFKQ